MTTMTERFYELHPTSRKLYEERSKGLFPDGVTHETRFLSPFPIYATRAEGPRKWDVDGNEYIDYVSGHGSLLLGHSHPAVVNAVTEQVSKGTHLGANTELEIKWGELVTKLIPSAEKVRFTSSGTEATLMAMRLARAYTGKSKIIKFFDHFHGWHDYAMANGNESGPGIPAATWQSMIVLPEVNDIGAVEKALDANDDTAAIILEPTGAHMGVSPIHPSYLEELRELTDRRGIVLIFDEVVTGFRSSPGGAQARFGVTPDMTSLAKILGGGLPGGAVAGKSDIVDMIQRRGDPGWDASRRVSHPGTFNANPISAAAGGAALELVANTNANAHAEAMATRLKDGVNQVMARLEIPGCAYGVASLVHLTMGTPVDPESINDMPHDKIRASMTPEKIGALKVGMLNAGVDPMWKTMVVSATHQEADIDFTVAAYEEAFTAMREEGVI